jgi:hypothetical protein
MSVRKLVVCLDGLVAAIIGHEHSAKVALYTPGQNEGFAPSWALNAHDRWRWYSDMVFFDGKLYALTNDEDLLALEVGYGENGEPRISSVAASSASLKVAIDTPYRSMPTCATSSDHAAASCSWSAG